MSISNIPAKCWMDFTDCVYFGQNILNVKEDSHL